MLYTTRIHMQNTQCKYSGENRQIQIQADSVVSDTNSLLISDFGYGDFF